MQPVDARMVSITTGFAAAAALAVAVTVPVAHFYFGVLHQSGHLEAETELQAQLMSTAVSRNPAFWRFESIRITELLQKRLTAHAPDRRRVTTSDGETVVDLMPPAGGLTTPVLAHSEPIYDSGTVVGEVEVARSVRPLLVRSLCVGVLSTLLGIGIFFALRILPLRALRKAMDRAAFLAHHDALTGLPNRVVVAERIAEAIARVRRNEARAAVFCLDLDHFKEVNDTLGHAAGDRLLCQVADRLGPCLRQTDTLGRLGGDEFAIIQFGINGPLDAARLAQRMIETLVEPFELDGHEATIGTSIGIAMCDRSDLDAADLLRDADTALYRAKADGRGVYRFFEEEMNRRLRERKALERDLREALRTEGFELHYQPQFDLRRQTMVGVEALLRWTHPERGRVPPAEFIPLCEETGLIAPLGDWVLRTACREARPWAHLRLAVNLSPAQFRRPDLAERVAEILADSDFPAERLELEITEGILLHDTEGTLATLGQLQALGVRIAMDDFGTGYSSLSYLRRFPFDKVKIDRSFVQDLGSDAEAAAIVRAIISLGRTLGMCTNAEGVETRDQATLLRQEGCQEVQGFFFGRPASAASIGQLVEAACRADATKIA